MESSRAPRIFLFDLLLEHFEELVCLANDRRQALRSPAYTRAEFEHVRERGAAHVDGLVIGAGRALTLLSGALAEEDPDRAYAAARALLEWRTEPATRLVLAALENSQAPAQAAALARALCMGSLETTQAALTAWYQSGSPNLAVAAAEALAYHRKLDRDSPRLRQLLEDPNPHVRRAAWRVAAIVE